jgi:hypothetical protein
MGVDYNGNRIGALVTDAKFNASIDAGEEFSKGDTLDVMLRIKQQYDRTVRAYINDGYEVVEVLGHVGRHKQTAFPFRRRVKAKKSSKR